jgi:hypothetical protein
VVEALLQQLGPHLAIALHHLHDVGRERFRQSVGDQAGGVGRQLRGFEHHGVASGQGAQQGLEAELKGVVPGPQNQNASQGFRVDPASGGPAPRGKADALARHPALQVAPGEFELLPHPHQFEIGLHRRFAQVEGQGLQQLRFGPIQQGLQPSKLLESPQERACVARFHWLAHGGYRWEEEGGRLSHGTKALHLGS